MEQSSSINENNLLQCNPQHLRESPKPMESRCPRFANRQCRQRQSSADIQQFNLLTRTPARTTEPLRIKKRIRANKNIPVSSRKRMKNNGKTHEVFDLAKYEHSEELKKAKSHSKKNHSKFTLLRCAQPGNKSPNLVFLAVSPEEKESWINVLNTAITRAKNRVLDEVTIEEESLLVHPTRDRAKIPLGRRLPTRGHLMAVGSTTSDGMLTLDLVNEEDAGMLDDDQDDWMKDHEVSLDKLAPARRRAGTDVSRPPSSITDAKMNTGSLPRQSEFSHSFQSHTPPNKKNVLALCRNRCASMDDVLSRGERKTTKNETLAQSPTDHLQDLIAQRLQRTQELLAEIQEQKPHRDIGSYPHLRGIASPRLRHLMGSDSPHSKGSSSHSSPHSRADLSPVRGQDSPGSKGKESPHGKSKDSPRFKTSISKSNFRSKSIDSPDSKESSSPHMKCIDLTHIRGSDSPISTGSYSPHSKCTEPVFFRVSYSPHVKNINGTDLTLSEVLDCESRREAAERLLQEAISSWREAREILAEVKELQARQQRAGQINTETLETPSQCRKHKSP
ncbi:Pleckstrin -like proteiny domain-containing family O member 1-A [Triplophysa tibetana]|uniref:Pleckstrin-like proteiny domain-containing family O member 1-A n=1 Tax=Triplophysa tibetana TaxID=1572043 RepID=A0A5A9NJZ7_9TELE|nr:Pleckstrin -like proteiny domain-containing family O member 1-A [Triplophysa tibetana]